MKADILTDILIEKAKECVGGECHTCSFAINCNGFESLIAKLADRLEQTDKALDKACNRISTIQGGGTVDYWKGRFLKDADD